LKHANARTFQAVLKYQPTQIELHMSDDGRGFDIAEEHQGFGLIGMRERVHGLKGRFALQSAIGQGTETLVTLDGPEYAGAGAPSNNGAQQ
jgi:signal transduction histidine kinase